MAALDELEEARAVWLAYETQFAKRRKREKHDGLRRPGTFDDWHRRTWGGNGVARCDDPAVHPTEPLAEVLRRLIAGLESGPGGACPVCAEKGIVWRADLSQAPWAGAVCKGCGIVVPRPVLTSEAMERAKRVRQRELASVA
ncbi:hypothetical protein M877_33440 [Streptomyces niveus NCIMB 11891]|nr:hypothetical protein M877_33440 [Streptomyces niveus NCIMB 11891]